MIGVFAEPTGRADLLELLSGTGIEIGALHRPVYAPHLDIKYVDRMTKTELLKQYPELSKESIVETDIVDDAEALRTLQDNSQDFVIANHVIEHMQNPIGALLAWQRVLKPGGRLFLAAPDKNFTFDKQRELTPVAHLLEDYEAPSDERDRPHFEEFALHVSCRTFHVKPEGEYKEFAQELINMEYSIHYHVWDHAAFKKFLQYLAMHFDEWEYQIVGEMPTIKDEFIFVLKKKAG